ncbi:MULTISPECIES: CDP-6-deoxy-delta-3,4-glucoseen reductase [Chromobacterium]|uniref:CDP-6-deoxy-delta-3,4-glucoseen reductase n=2 Tax=Chromobacterium TaxID=535 RepID=A0ABS3GNS5_9NEIS|nr:MULTISPECIES: CDP-6-deoxy-delta-3,4-glucoseen reductase [Chromobacterium]AXT48091.1 CDP-6-deoxy-delta-3,4-glucoseen reductase [Chromobacterium rhizoryzae]MBK0414932.1 CDP-6-deoxy-delta-3,4-glucoseen reductase [Chromobacterium haemolyticum]MBO0416398.1 CDP-6-deoxy-delta-3,4-glucoseen reductase [Chromobacterium haemolyticum]MBO0499571.1 CDP-6-deoxy-delta-3,4-glucoseen reductase [Chromobacterium haemolyticum]OQS39535.1 CDP-6-deoxy-delta-3,4-glucoseen reductase [Chromobacterium haemolyticum]
MTAQVKVLPSGHTFGVEPHETVLEAALRQGVGLPYGCRDGACGACKGKVVDGEVSQDGYQEKALTEAERAQGLALFCCARPQGDITIEAREVAGAGDIQIKTLPCRVEKIEKIHDVAVLKLKLPVSERLQFKAGQYIDILMKDGKKRSFSIANAPHDDAFLELHIRHQPGGSFSDYVFSQMKEREIMRFKGPLGSFFLREDSDKPILFVASGTGFAPVKGIIEHAIHSGIQREMVFYWGARTKADLYMAELAGAWQAQNPNITFIPVLSDALPTDEWAGRTGFVHQAVLEDFENLSGYQVYACGAPLMVEAAHGSFTRERGLPEDEFFSDAFFLSKDMGGSK